MTAFLSMWTIYESPPGLYGKFLARLVELDDEIDPADPGASVRLTDRTIIGDTLDDVRGRLPPGLYRMDRQPGDNPAIVETWI